MMKSKSSVLLGTLFLTAMLGGCTQKYLRQKEADDRMIASLNTDLRASKEALEEAHAECANYRQQLSDAEKRLASAIQDRDAYKSKIDEFGKKPAEPDAATNLKNRIGGKGVDVEIVNGLPRITLSNEVTFASGQADISKQGKDILRKLAAVIKSDYPGQKVWVCGHTDNEPIKKSKYKSNLYLSVARSLSVISFLEESCGVPEKKLICVGHGQWQPRTSNATSGGKALNRRVEFLVTE